MLFSGGGSGDRPSCPSLPEFAVTLEKPLEENQEREWLEIEHSGE